MRFLCLLVLAFTLSSCDESLSIHLTFPDGFRGLARLRSNQPDGLTLDTSKRTRDLRFSSDGVCDIRGDLPTLKWHQVTARYSNGKPIPVISSAANATPETFGVWSAGLAANNTEDWFVVGTHKDLEAATEKKDGFKWPPK